MGYEKTLPANHLIALFTVLTIFLLGGLHFAFDSYFTRVATAEVSEKVLTVEPVKLHRLRQDEARRLSATNLGDSMRAIAGGARPVSITPQKGIDLEARLAQLGALSGWAEDSHPLALAIARREEAHAYLAEMQASVEKARAEGNEEALDSLLPRLKTAQDAVARLDAEAAEIIGNQTEAGVVDTVRNADQVPAVGTQPESPTDGDQAGGAQQSGEQEGSAQQGTKPRQPAPNESATDAGRQAPTGAKPSSKPAADAGRQAPSVPKPNPKTAADAGTHANTGATP